MKKVCPFCNQSVIGSFEHHVSICSQNDAREKAPELMEELGSQDELGTALAKLFQFKEFEEFFKQSNVIEQTLMLVCTECYQYGIPIHRGGTTCPTCGGEIVNARDFLEELEKEAN